MESKSYYGILEAELTPEDIQVIKKAINGIPRILLTVAITLSLFGFCIVYFVGVEPLLVIIFLTCSLVVTAVTFLIVGQGYTKVIARGKKLILRGTVTDRYEKPRTNDSDSIKEYFFIIADNKLKLDRSVYARYNVGDAIELHYVSQNPSLKILVVKDHFLNVNDN